MKTLVSIFTFFVFFSVFSQDKRILPPSGNNLFISDIEFNKESNRLVSVGMDSKIVVWDIASKKPIKTINEHRRPIHSIAFNEKGDRFATASEDSTIKIWDAYSFKLIASLKFGSPVYYAEYDRMDNFLIATSPNGTVKIYNASDLKLHKEYKIESTFLNQAILSTNSKLFFTGDKDGTFKALGVEDGKEYINHNMETGVISMKFSKDKSILILHLESGRAELLAMPDLKALGALPAPTKQLLDNVFLVSEIDISTDGRWLIGGQSNGHIDIIRLETMIKQAVVSKHPFISQSEFSRDGRYSASVGTDLNITVLDLLDYGDTSSRRVPYKLLRMESDIPRWLQFHPDSTIAISGYYSNHWDLKTGIFTSLPAFEENYEDYTHQFDFIKADDHEFYYDLKSMLFVIKADTFVYRPFNIQVSKNEHFIAYQRHNKIYHYDLRTKKLIDHHDNNKRIICVGNDGKYVASGDEKGININGKTIKLPYQANNADIKGNQLIIGTLEDEYYLFDLNKNKLLATNRVEPGEAACVKFFSQKELALIAGYTKKITAVDPKTGKKYYSANVTNSITDAIALSPDDKMIALNTDDRIIRILENKFIQQRIDKKLEVYTLKDHGAVAVTKDGYYLSGNSAHKQLGFFYKDKVYPGSYFDLEFNRPDLVLKESQYANQKTIDFYKEIVDSRVKKTGDLFAMDLPFIEFSNKAEYSVQFEDKNNELKMKCKLPDGYKTEDLAFFNNNVPVYPKTSLKGNELTIKYKLIPGKNKLEVCPKKNDNFGLKDYYEITYDVKVKPNLYLVCMGVSEYADSSFNLKYAAKDTKDFYDEIIQSKEFDQINKKIYVNKDVTRDKLKEIQSFLKNAEEKDVVMIFIAGHGVLDANFQYYFATHDLDFNKPSDKGISFYDLESMLSNIQAINKVLFMDTCHSGELDEDEIKEVAEEITDGDITFRGSNSLSYSQEYQNKVNYMNTLFSDLRTNNGAVVLSSSSGVEFSMEGEKWKNGLFTYCLLKGLREFEGDLDRDGKIQINELLSFVKNKVHFLSKGKQSPTLRQSNLALDLKIK